MPTNYKNRLKIPLDGRSFKFFTKCGTLVATGYNRIVIGGRGPYVEFGKGDILIESFHIPKSQKFRVTDKRVYYIEGRSKDSSNVKLYYQKRPVGYADYKIGMLYISPFDLFDERGDVLIEPMRKSK